MCGHATIHFSIPVFINTRVVSSCFLFLNSATVHILRSYREAHAQLCLVPQMAPKGGSTNLLPSQQGLGTFAPAPTRQEGNATMTDGRGEEGALIGGGDKRIDIPAASYV